MAYGSPDRIEDVPAYYADIRGGRPVRPELLADLTERYRRLGIEESNPLNEITERTRAALETELGLPVFTGMKHWTPRIADAAEAALDAGATTIVGLVLAPHYSRLSIGGYRQQLEEALAGRAELAFVDSWHDEPGFVELLADRVRGTARARRLHRPLAARADPRRGRSVPGAAARDEPRSSPKRPGLDDWSFCVPVRVADRRAVARARHPRPPRRAPRPGRRPTSSSARSGSSPTTSRSAGTSTSRRRSGRPSSGCALARIEMPNADPAFVAVLAAIVRRALAVPSSA